MHAEEGTEGCGRRADGDRPMAVRPGLKRSWGDLLLKVFSTLLSLTLLVRPACGAARRSTTAGIYGRVVPIPAGTKAHYNIQNFAGPGTYKFGYDTGSGPNQSFRQEERGQDGKVKGRYGYVEPSGALRVVEYMADATGFHILKTRTMVPDMKPKAAVKVRTPFVGPLPPFIPTSYVVNLAG